MPLSGCSVHYFDANNNIEHIWGIGHMAMKSVPANEGVKAVSRRTDLAGFSIGRLEEGIYFNIGWDTRQRIDIVDEDTQLCMAWPRSSSFYNVRIGTKFPSNMNDCGITQQVEEKQ